MALLVHGVMRVADCPKGARRVTSGALCALVGGIGDGEVVRVRRDALRTHSDALMRAMEHGPVLPMRFGVALPDEQAVARELLEPNADMFAARLDALEGKAEMQVKATFAEAALLR